MPVNKIDLHTHSTKSDGTLTPTQLIQKAVQIGLEAIALTDHDTVEGVLEADQEAHRVTQEPFEFIPGVELSVSYQGQELHIVGLYLDIHTDHFGEVLGHLQENRERRNYKMIQKMQDAGIDISMEKLRAEQGNGVLTRGNFARYLKNHGYIQTIQEGFDRYLSPGKPFYVLREYMSYQSAIDTIHAAGGLAFLAHPVMYHMSEEKLEAAIREFKDCGIDGIETYYSVNTPADTENALKLAQKYDLIRSGGSDFHGSNKPHISLGSGQGDLYIPADVLMQQRNYLKKSRNQK